MIERSLISAPHLSSDKLDKGPNRFVSHCDISTRRRGSAKGHSSSTDLAGGAYSERPRVLFRRFGIDPNARKLEQPHWHLSCTETRDIQPMIARSMTWCHVNCRFGTTSIELHLLVTATICIALF